MRRSFLGMVFAIAFVFVNPRPSHAQEQSQQVADTDARTLFQLGQSAFDQGRYQAALDYFQQAYDLSQRPQLLYNIGQSADRLRLDRRALTAFERFLSDAPESPQHAPTRARVEVLRAAVAEADARDQAAAAAAAATIPAQAAATVETPSTTPASPEESSGGSPTAGWIIAGAGGGALIAGGVLLAMGFSDKSAVENASDGSSFASVEDQYDRASTRITVGSILMGVGAAAGATGIVLAIRGSHDEHPDTASLDVRVLPTGFVLRRVF